MGVCLFCLINVGGGQKLHDKIKDLVHYEHITSSFLFLSPVLLVYYVYNTVRFHE